MNHAQTLKSLLDNLLVQGLAQLDPQLYTITAQLDPRQRDVLSQLIEQELTCPKHGEFARALQHALDMAELGSVRQTVRNLVGY